MTASDVWALIGPHLFLLALVCLGWRGAGKAQFERLARVQAPRLAQFRLCLDHEHQRRAVLLAVDDRRRVFRFAGDEADRAVDRRAAAVALDRHRLAEPDRPEL